MKKSPKARKSDAPYMKCVSRSGPHVKFSDSINNMDGINLMNAFKAVCGIFGVAAVFTGLQAITNPTGFASSFGIPLSHPSPKSPKPSTAQPGPAYPESDPASSYIALLGARQLGTGITLLVLAYQGKWIECATILSIIGVVVAGMDGWYLARSGNLGAGVFHAGPGLGIAALAGAVVWAG
ncbi:uncharacterized protein M421DRAFT_7018 [Didymella exigua CBS 183.55]|uniref:Uncharacterized protein n=1 Tax=Didymella exigua CBS 183.55 TaxID=1150837 RepID=A0A6A5RG03_9PLEO|nr:uncharacterized protein M421DRAFT_7018 [Didymella exigua CBS 183.55]KAF1926409.1 hypothetical protein M421DRAFT_7018 [Didymella exigua CBS 183.55]